MENKRKIALILFSATFVIIVSVFAVSFIKTDRYNKKVHHDTYTGEALFRVDDDRDRALSVRTETRSSTWTKLFDIYNEGLTEHNYQAYTYDFYISDIPVPVRMQWKFPLSLMRV